MDKHIFISYNHNDGDFAEILINRITEGGFKAWVDAEKLNAGEDWRVDIDQAIKNAFALIVVMTPDAKASEYVAYEWSFAWGAGVKVIPIILKQTTLHPRLATLQYLDFTNRLSRPWQKLIEAIKNAEDIADSPAKLVSQNISAEQIIEAASLLVSALAHTHTQRKDVTQTSDVEKTKETAERINQLVSPNNFKQIPGASVLWVDDNPTNNTYEQQALEILGIQFTIAISTTEALNLLSHNTYDVIISDMGRPPDKHAGYTLLKEIKDRQINTPFIIYAGSKSQEHIIEARNRGALGTTNNPQELFEMVVDAIKNS